MQGHEHISTGANGSFPQGFTLKGQGTYPGVMSSGFLTGGIDSDGTNGTPRVGEETRGKNLTVRYWKRIT